MSRVHFISVCHCDRVEWDNTHNYNGMELAIKTMIETTEKIEDENRVKIPMTYLPCFLNDDDGYSIAHEKTDLFKELRKIGNEIGVHTHVDYDKLPNQDKFIVPDADALEDLGFPRPKTWAAGDWYTTPNTIRQLEKGRYAVDGSVVPLEGKFYHGSRNQFELDYSKCKTLSPYHPSYEDICQPGASLIIEPPVTSWLPEICYWDQHFPLTEEKLEERLLSKWRKRDEIGIDVFHIFWHPQDLWYPHGAWYPQDSSKPRKIDSQLVKGFERLLHRATELEGVVFSTAYQAARDWELRKRNPKSR